MKIMKENNQIINIKYLKILKFIYLIKQNNTMIQIKKFGIKWTILRKNSWKLA